MLTSTRPYTPPSVRCPQVEEDLYALDFAYPFSIEVAFSIALASIDTKLCYTL